MADEITRDGKTAVNGWLDATQTLKMRKDAVNQAEVLLWNAESALLKWLCPPDVRPGEKIAVWYLDSLVQGDIHSINPLEGEITIRTRGRELGR